MVIGHQKGSDTESNIFRNFGSPYPEGFRKAQRLMLLADKLGMPLVTFLDTADIYGGGQSEEYLGRALKGRRGQAVIASKFGMKLGEGQGARPEMHGLRSKRTSGC